MFLIHSEKELLESFLPRHQRQLVLPTGVRYPLLVRDYFAWSEPAGPRVHVVFAEPDGGRKPLGLVFDRDSGGAGGHAAICEWCHSYGSSQQIGLLTIRVAENRRVGVYLCRDLSCHEKIEENTCLTPVAAQERQRRVVEAMSRFARRTLF